LLVKHFQHYLYGHECIVYTDHEPLRSYFPSLVYNVKLNPPPAMSIPIVLTSCGVFSNRPADSLSHFQWSGAVMRHDICEEELQLERGRIVTVLIMVIVSQSMVVRQELITIWIRLEISWLLLYCSNCRCYKEQGENERWTEERCRNKSDNRFP